MEERILLIGSGYGAYIPRDFSEYDYVIINGKQYPIELNADDYAELSSPDNELYWDTWDRILNNTVFETPEGSYVLEHNEDLWLVKL